MALPVTPTSNLRKRNLKRIEKGRKATEALRARVYFRFLDLPAEIRNMIYNYALVADPFIEIIRVHGPPHIFDGIAKRRPGRSKKAKEMIAPQLLCVCKQINQEARTILYSRNHFYFGRPGDLSAFFNRYATRINDVHRLSLRLNTAKNAAAKGAFSALAHANSLEQVQIIYRMRDGGNVGSSALYFYNAAHDWLRTVGLRKGDKKAALKVLGVRPITFHVFSTYPDPYGIYSTDSIGSVTQQERQFGQILGELLMRS